jgi:hypothetical protein
MILTKSNLYQQHAGNKKFTKLQFFLLHLFPFTEHTLIKLWQNSMKLKISLFSSIFPFIVVNKIDLVKAKNLFIQSFCSTFLGVRITPTSMNMVNKTSALFCALALDHIHGRRGCTLFPVIMCRKNGDVKTIYLQNIFKI